MPATKIIPRIFGGIGNQLFCYAAARRLAIANNSELVIDHISGFEHDQVYSRMYQLDHFNIPCRKATASERLEPFSRMRRFIKRKWNQRLPLSKRTYIQQEDDDFNPFLIHYKPKRSVYLEGYWQSESYFKDIEPTIRQDLQIERPPDIANENMAKVINSCMAVAVHVRFFEEPQALANCNAPLGFYARAVKEVINRIQDAHFFIFSDRPEEGRKYVSLPDDRVTVVGHNNGDAYAYADLWLMTQCKHFIIANSTFSWWGAWLSCNPGKIVVAPGLMIKNSKTAWGFAGLLPKQWVKL